MHAQDKLDLDAALRCGLAQLDSMDDAAVVLHALRDVKEDMHLEVFDRIVICRGGVSLASITNTSLKCGLSVSVEVFDFRKRLQGALAGGGYTLRSLVGWIAIVGVLSAVVTHACVHACKAAF
jgi:hypothetical protein